MRLAANSRACTKPSGPNGRRLEASAALINRHRDDLAEAIRDAIDALEATKPTPGFLGIQIGVTGTRDRLDTVINDLEQAVTQADRETRKFVEGD
jgi:hypothetical protein